MMLGLGAVSQSAIDACTAQGGHMIIFPDGIPSCEVPSDPATRLPAYTGPAVEVGPAYSGIDWGSVVVSGDLVPPPYGELPTLNIPLTTGSVGMTLPTWTLIVAAGIAAFMLFGGKR